MKAVSTKLTPTHPLRAFGLIVPATAVLLLAACGGSAAPSSSAAAASAAASSPAAAASVSAAPSSAPPASVAASASAAASSAPSSGAPGVSNPASPVTLHESGSTLVLPYLQKLASPVHTALSNLTLEPSGGGSGKGIADAIGGTVQMGGSDAYLSDAQATQNPTLLNIPIAISAQAINYNLAGIKDLKITGDILAKMYEHHITNWNDPAIAAVNPGVTLPNQAIIPVRRVDASGDTFIFTSLLTATNAEWKAGPAFGTSVTWPALPGELTANGNPAMIQVCKANPGCVAYIGVSVEQAALSAGLGEALLQNKAGTFLQPTQDTITAAVSAGATNTPNDLRQSLVYEDGAQSYPIVNFEYLMVNSKQSDANTAAAIKSFLTWSITAGATPSNLASVDFVALPTSVVPKVEAAIAKIGA